MRHDPIICHRLSFGIRPPANVVRRVADLFALPGMEGRRVRAANLHIAIETLEDSLFYPARLVQAARTVGATIDLPPFDIILDRLAGSHNRVALRPSRRLPALQQLYDTIRAAGADAGLPDREGYRFTPSMTVLYREGAPFTRPIEPIVWRVEGVVLIDSLVGSARQETIGGWPLKLPPEEAAPDAPRQYALL